MRLAIAIIIAVVLSGAAYAQIAGTGGGTRALGPRFDKRWSDFGMGLGGGMGGGGAVLTPCLAGQLDFSLATGCNVTFYVLGVT